MKDRKPVRPADYFWVGTQQATPLRTAASTKLQRTPIPTGRLNPMGDDKRGCNVYIGTLTEQG